MRHKSNNVTVDGVALTVVVLVVKECGRKRGEQTSLCGRSEDLRVHGQDVSCPDERHQVRDDVSQFVVIEDAVALALLTRKRILLGATLVVDAVGRVGHDIRLSIRHPFQQLMFSPLYHGGQDVHFGCIDVVRLENLSERVVI
jgi:hypothetical protein